MTTPPPAYALRKIGMISQAQGLHGEVVLVPADSQATWLGTLKSVFVVTLRGPIEMQIESARRHGTGIVMKFAAINNRNDAEALARCEVKAPACELPQLAEDEFYTDELEGLTVVSQELGETLGVVKEVLSASTGEYLEVVPPNLSEPVLVPFQAAFIVSIDRDAKQIMVKGLDEFFTVE